MYDADCESTVMVVIVDMDSNGKVVETTNLRDAVFSTLSNVLTPLTVLGISVHNIMLVEIERPVA